MLSGLVGAMSGSLWATSDYSNYRRDITAPANEIQRTEPVPKEGGEIPPHDQGDRRAAAGYPCQECVTISTGHQSQAVAALRNIARIKSFNAIRHLRSEYDHKTAEHDD